MDFIAKKVVCEPSPNQKGNVGRRGLGLKNREED
jgi:hypothetical protein